ncbi:MAG TPA: hypothetical protein PKD53_09805, partial [Chloroflexaceae bacterium]|nr:hypothetical protein [Chloroflexaceae bacterium]
LSGQTNSPRGAGGGVGRVLAMAGVPGLRLGVLPRRSPRGPAAAPTWRSADRILVQQSMF